MLIKSLLFSAVALVASPEHTGLERCDAMVQREPFSDAFSLCYYLQAHNKSERGEALGRLARLQQRFPNEPYLDLARAYMLRQESPRAAIEVYARAAAAFERAQDHTGHALCRVGRIAIFNNLGLLDELRAELPLLDDFVEKVPNETWRVYAKAKMLRFRASFSIDIGESYNRISKMKPPRGRKDSWWAQAELLSVRGAIARTLLDFDAAERDYLELLSLATKKGDKVKASMAWGQLARISYARIELFSDASEVEKAHERFEKAITSARQLGFYSAQVAASGQYASLLGGIEGQSGRALALIEEECMAACEREGSPEGRGACLAYRSQLRARLDPEAAMHDAIAGLELMARSKDQGRRILAWRQVMRRFWEQRPIDQAERVGMAALEAIESIRKLQGDFVTRRQVFASWTGDYQWLATRFMEQGPTDSQALEKAFGLMERTRGRVLLESIQHEARDMDAAVSEAARLSSIEERTLRWIRSQSVENKENKAAEGSTLHGLSTAQDFSTIADVQALLEADEAMLSYLSGPKQAIDGERMGGSWVMLVTPSSVKAIALRADRPELESKVRFFRELLRHRRSSLGNGARALRELVLDPATQALPAQTRKLIVVPDGPLHGLSFAAIGEGRFSFSLTPSATLWAQGRTRGPQLSRVRGVALVDPLRDHAIASPSAWQVRSSWARGDSTAWAPLPYSRYESQAINENLGAEVKILVGKSATKTALAKTWSGNSNFVHLSAHSIVNTIEGDRSALVLSDAQGGDGLLSIQEITAHSMKDAVVVLGGCSTAWGATVMGEGVLSIARAFQRAGARAVVASQWPVRDDESAIFFQHFYAALGRGDSLGGALLQAQRVMKEDGFSLPAYSAFVILGDSRIRFPARSVFERLATRDLCWFFCLGLFPVGLVLVLSRSSSPFAGLPSECGERGFRL